MGRIGMVMAFVLGGQTPAVRAGDNVAPAVDFGREIRPLFNRVCAECHGPDQDQRQAGLRLDRPQGVFRATDGSPLIRPGHPEQSDLVKRIRSADPDYVMPPPAARQRLTATEVERIETWIRQGAQWDEHWAFVAPRRPALPALRQAAWTRNPIDHFVWESLKNEELSPSPVADRRTLVRRLHLDLTGLPPTADQVREFLADRRPDAYEALVDRLLGSPRFGERIALPWLDAARYADTHGYHEDYHREMWPWRDWVIDALNQNMPFDQFSIEQLAGDLLPEATPQQVIATGFNRNHGVTASGISEEYRVEYVLDRVRTTATVWLGLTMECGQCHDHKYDPISQQDFYRFFAYFNNITDRGVENREGNVDPLVTVRTPDIDLQLLAVEDEIAVLDRTQKRYRSRSSEAVHRWAASAASEKKQPLPGGLLLHLPLDNLAGAGVVDGLEGEPVGTITGSVKRVTGKFQRAVQFDGKTHIDLGDRLQLERTDAFSYGAWVYPTGSGGAILSRMDDAADYRGWDLFLAGDYPEFHMIHQWPGNAIHAKAAKPLPAGEWTHLFVTYDGSSKASGFQLYFNGVAQEVNVTRDGLTATIQTEKPFHVGRRNPSGHFVGRIDELRVYRGSLPAAAVAVVAGASPITGILRIAAAERTPDQVRTLTDYFLQTVDGDYRKLEQRRIALRAQQEQLQQQATKQTVMVMQEMEQRRATFLLKRGQYDQPGEQVSPGTPGFLHPLAQDARPDRLGLARWIVAPQNPLTSRVTVNRFWQMLYGAGLVVSAEDFGTQGQLPTHPELLDWLAVEFVESGWDIKQMLSRMATSSTYRQSSVVPSRLQQRDPSNRLLARGSRYRMPAELIRDNALAISGLLVGQVGGASVKPYQPQGLWLETSNRPYQQDAGASLYRRSLYVYWKRSVPPPTLFSIDAPTREVCIVRRQRTNTPLMALVLLNDPTFVEAARQLAQRSLELHPRDMEAGIDEMFARATSRPPRERERKILREIYRQQYAIYQNDPAAAAALLEVGESVARGKIDAARHAALTMLANTILNLDETMTRE
ncbi:MAG: DUF1553 domain-containing protein [Planctomycetota bacterium]|nr:DUF1553 domain-containing protein [Planctomycetota bacterium]